jgi:hybrid cluster-associated redox disulfide protein
MRDGRATLPGIMRRSPPLPRADQTVAEVLATWPQTIRVFLEHKMGCVGCTMSGFDTVSDAVASYGGTLDTFLTQLAATARDGVAR